MAGICTANTSPNSCGHRRLTVSLDGVNFTLNVHDSDLDAMAWGDDEKRAFLLLGAKYARARGLSMVNALNRVFIGEEATNVKQYAILTRDVTKTNIGTSYVNIPPGLNGERCLVDFTGCTQFRIVLNANLIGTGAHAARIVKDSDNTVLFESTNLGAAGERELDSDWQTIPGGFAGLEVLRLQGKSATGADDPVYRRCILLTR